MLKFEVGTSWLMAMLIFSVQRSSLYYFLLAKHKRSREGCYTPVHSASWVCICGAKQVLFMTFLEASIWSKRLFVLGTEVKAFVSVQFVNSPKIIKERLKTSQWIRKFGVFLPVLKH